MPTFNGVLGLTTSEKTCRYVLHTLTVLVNELFVYYTHVLHKTIHMCIPKYLQEVASMGGIGR